MGIWRARKETEVIDWEQSLKETEKVACTDVDREGEWAREEHDVCPVALRTMGKPNSVNDCKNISLCAVKWNLSLASLKNKKKHLIVFCCFIWLEQRYPYWLDDMLIEAKSCFPCTSVAHPGFQADLGTEHMMQSYFYIERILSALLQWSLWNDYQEREQRATRTSYNGSWGSYSN